MNTLLHLRSDARRLLLLCAVCLLAPTISLAQTLYVVNDGNNTVGAYSVATGAAVSGFTTITGLSDPDGLAPSGNTLYVSNVTSNMIGAYNATTGAAINASLVTGLAGPGGIAVSGNTLYVANYNGNVGTYNATTGTAITANFIPTVSGHPVLLLLSGNTLYVGYSGSNTVNTVKAFDATTGAALASFTSLSGFNNAQALAVLGNSLYVADYGTNVVSQYNATTGAVINANFITGLNGPDGLTVSGNSLFVSNQYTNIVTEYDSTTGVPVTGFNSPSGLNAPGGMATVLQMSIQFADLYSNTFHLDSDALIISGDLGQIGLTPNTPVTVNLDSVNYVATNAYFNSSIVDPINRPLTVNGVTQTITQSVTMGEYFSEEFFGYTDENYAYSNNSPSLTFDFGLAGQLNVSVHPAFDYDFYPQTGQVLSGQGLMTATFTLTNVIDATKFSGGLGNLQGGSSSEALAVSNQGTVVGGASTNANSTFDAVLWTLQTGMTGLNFNSPQLSASINGLSANGAVAVGSRVLGGNNTAVRLTTGNQTAITLSNLSGQPVGSTNAIAANGVYSTGWSGTANGSFQQAVLWDSTGNVTDLGTLSGSSAGYHSEGRAISGDGSVVVGWSNPAGATTGTEMIRWTQSSGMQALGYLAGGTSYSRANGISADGTTIVGVAGLGAGDVAMKWTQSGGMVSLGDFSHTGAANSYATSASADGAVIVGYGTQSSGQTAAVWDQNYGMRSLQSVLSSEYDVDFTGWTLQEAMAISPDSTTTVGYGLSPQGNTQAFTAHINYRNSQYASGASYAGFHTSKLGGSGTTVDLLAGTAGAARTVTADFVNGVNALASGVASDAVNFAGTSGDLFVLQMSYNPALAPQGAKLASYNGSAWLTAVDGNAGGNPTEVTGAYDGNLSLGRYGVDTVNHVVWAVLNYGGQFAAVPVTPDVTLGTPTNITTTSVTLNGTVNPNGLTTTAQFQYGLNTSYGNTVSVTPSPSNGGAAQAVNANLTNLQTGTIYHYLLTATNAAGTSFTSDATFTTISNNANLSGLALSTGNLSPSFSSGATSYTANVSSGTSSITVTPTVANSFATVTVNGTSVASGTASGAINLTPGANTIAVVATAQDGVTTQTYTVTVTRPLAWTYNSATDLPSSASSFTLTGTTATLSLNFAPPAGTNLIVVKNTGLGFVNGAFSNLAQGQVVTMGYNGVNYNFVANYYGGSGNDLMLEWANAVPMAWGDNASGQLGNNSSTDSLVPVAVTTTGVLSGKTVISQAAGAGHSLALCSDGTVAAWGYNHFGELGNTSNTNRAVPVLVANSGVLSGKTVIAVEAGAYHSVALCSDGTVATWGSNSNGQLGNNTMTDSNVAVAVSTAGVLSGKTVVSVATGGYHSVALCSDGTVVAWGDNSNGQLGNNGTSDSAVPAVVSTSGVLSGKTVIAVAAGQFHSLALCSDGTVVGWGYNGDGELGNNSTTDSDVPVAVNTAGVLAGKTVTALGAGKYHSLALCADGKIAAWGYNTDGELGNNSTSASSVPVLVTTSGVLSGKTVVAVTAGAFHSVAVASDGTMAAWGSNSNGQLGNNSNTNSPAPVLVSTAALANGARFVTVSGGPAALSSLAIVAWPDVPTVTTLAATSITATSATLNATVNGNNSTTEVGFVYGPTTSYGTFVGATPPTVTGTSATAVSAALTGLAPGTTYHFRVSTANFENTGNGGDLSFTTLTTLQAWRLTYYGTTNNSGNAADTASPYGTGISNLDAFAFFGPNQNPAQAKIRLLPQAQRSGGNLFFSFTQPAGVSGVTYGAEWSTTLAPGSWQPISDTGSGSAHLFSVPIGSNANLFIRLKTTDP